MEEDLKQKIEAKQRDLQLRKSQHSQHPQASGPGFSETLHCTHLTAVHTFTITGKTRPDSFYFGKLLLLSNFHFFSVGQDVTIEEESSHTPAAEPGSGSSTQQPFQIFVDSPSGSSGYEVYANLSNSDYFMCI